MSSHQELINTLYQAFQRLDYKTMASCYHADATFKDEVFNLEGKEISAMWHMLCAKAQDFELDYQVINPHSNLSVNWQANYLFSQTNRPVNNIITARFEFKDGLIIKHIDKFDFWRWSRQALGLSGVLLGWTPFLRKKVSQLAKQNLQRFMAKNP